MTSLRLQSAVLVYGRERLQQPDRVARRRTRGHAASRAMQDTRMARHDVSSGLAVPRPSLDRASAW